MTCTQGTSCLAFTGLTLALENALDHYVLGAGITGGHCWPRDFRKQLSPKLISWSTWTAQARGGSPRSAWEGRIGCWSLWDSMFCLASGHSEKKCNKGKSKRYGLLAWKESLMTNTLACVSAQRACPPEAQLGFLRFLQGKVRASSRNNIFFFLSKFMVLTMGGSRCQNWSTI